MMATIPDGSEIMLPGGRIVATIDTTVIPKLSQLRLVGVSNAGAQGSYIVGNTPGPLVKAAHAFYARQISFTNTNPLGTTVSLDNIDDAVIDQCVFHGNRQLAIGLNSVTNNGITIRDSRFTGSTIPGITGTGIVGKGQICLQNITVKNCAIGADIAGSITFIGVNRFEENAIALRAGRLTYFEGTIGNSVFEANDIHILLTKNVEHTTLRNIKILGDKYQGHQYPTYGIRGDAIGGKLTLDCVDVQGNFQQAAIKLHSPGSIVIINSSAGNGGMAGSTTAWDLDSPAITTIQTELPAPLVQSLIRKYQPHQLRTPNAQRNSNHF